MTPNGALSCLLFSESLSDFFTPPNRKFYGTWRHTTLPGPQPKRTNEERQLKRFSPRLSIILAATVLFGLAAPGVYAQENTQTVEEEDIKMLETEGTCIDSNKVFGRK